MPYASGDRDRRFLGPPHDRHGAAPTDRIAIAAVVIAVGNIVFGSFLGLFLPPFPAVTAVVAVILGHVALARIGRTGDTGRGLALSALVLGYLWLAGTLLLVGAMLMFTGFGPALLGF